MNGWNADLVHYTAWLQVGGSSRHSIRMQLHYVTTLARAHSDPWRVTLDDLALFLSSPNWGPESRKCARTSIRGFYRWAVNTERIDRSPADRLPPVRVPIGKPRPAPDVVLRDAFAKALPRERLMLMFAAYAGLRCSEIAKVNSRDVVQGSLRVAGKGGRVRNIPLHPVLLSEIDHHGPGWLFPGNEDGHLSAMWITKLLSGLLADGWTAHTLRHRFASLAYAHQRDLRAVQELLGHSKPETTARYTAVPDGAMRDAVYAVAPVAA